MIVNHVAVIIWIFGAFVAWLITEDVRAVLWTVVVLMGIGILISVKDI